MTVGYGLFLVILFLLGWGTGEVSRHLEWRREQRRRELDEAREVLGLPPHEDE